MVCRRLEFNGSIRNCSLHSVGSLSGDTLMKKFTWTALLATAIVVVPIILMMKKDKEHLLPIQVNENLRYDINDYMEDQGL
jgi:hypothetical protein